MSFFNRVTAVIVGSLMLYGSVAAQDVPPPVGGSGRGDFGSAGVPSLPVDLLPPGARALGLAGAFTAVADDATAAEANPAGLTILSQPEISIHLRDSDISAPFVDPEALDPGAFGPGNGQLIKTYEDSGSDVSFASIVKPFDRWVFSAFYGNQLELSAATPTESFLDPVFVDAFTNDNALSAEVESFGLSAAFRINDMFSLGISVKQVELEISAFESITIDDFNDFEFDFSDFLVGTPFEGTPEQYAAVINDQRISSARINGDDSDTVFNVGLLVNPNGKWSFGLVYKEGGSFGIPTIVSRQQILNCTGSGTLADFCNLVFDPANIGQDFLDQFNNNVDIRLDRDIVIPDRLTLGLAVRPSDTLLLSLDLNRVEYSDLTRPRGNSLGLGVGLDREPLSDEISYHVGVEKVFPLSGEWLNVFTIRAGTFEEKDHDSFRILDTDDTHYTFGIGAVIRNLQLDLAFESADAVDNIVLSGIYRFD